MQITSGLPASFNPEEYDMIVVGAGYAGSVSRCSSAAITSQATRTTT